MVYTVGRAWIEYLRIDDANHILGLRLNDWTAIIVFIGALIYFLRVKGPREIPGAGRRRRLPRGHRGRGAAEILTTLRVRTTAYARSPTTRRDGADDDDRSRRRAPTSG